MEESRKRKILLIVGIITLLVVVIGASYAYFMAQLGAGASTDVIIQADSIDSLQFTTGGPLSININQDNFGAGGTNKKASTTATATLIAGTNRTPNYTYNVYLAIKENAFVYTTSSKKPEIVLRVTAPGNVNVTSIDGLTYNTELGGFDITEVSEIITIAKNYAITTTSTLKQNWKIEVEIINLDSNQNANASSIFLSELKIQQVEIVETLAEVCSSGDNFAECIKTYADSSSYLYSRIIHHDEFSVNSANDGSYRYAGGDYKISDTDKDTYSKIHNDLIKYNSDNYFVYLDYYKSHEYITKGKALKQALVDGYVEGDMVKNFVCFGSEATTCPNDNLYRIIGVFDGKIKLIKYDYANKNLLGTDEDYYLDTNLEDYEDWKYLGKHENYSRYSWNKNSYHSPGYNNSELNKTNLNKNFLNNIGTKWSGMIVNNSWRVQGMSYHQGLYNQASVVYTYEVGNSDVIEPEYTEAKIGLMYLSDYMFAASPKYWTKPAFGGGGQLVDNYSSTIDDNWLNMGITEWTISRSTDGNELVFLIAGSANANADYAWYSNAIRPVFYLDSSVKYISGVGTMTNPYRIGL